jgi:hypothetical protein
MVKIFLFDTVMKMAFILSIVFRDPEAPTFNGRSDDSVSLMLMIFYIITYWNIPIKFSVVAIL